MRLTNNRKQKCVEIFNRLDDHIPLRNYVAEVLRDLEARGIFYRPGVSFTESQVVSTRNLRSFHYEIALAFERLYDPEPLPPPAKKASKHKNIARSLS